MREQSTQEGSEARRHRLANSFDNRAWAVAYCENGFEIIPLIPGTKHPAIRNPHPHGSRERGRCKGECGLLGHGFHDANANAEWADMHWTLHPADGIGVRPPAGVIVLDVDVRRRGIETLAALTAGRALLPETLTTISGRGDGGHHRWFDNVPGPVSTKLCDGVDILCRDRNFVVVPPSLHPVNLQPYTFKKPIADIADAPGWVAAECARPEPPPRPSRPQTPVGGRWRLSPAQTLQHCRGLVSTVTSSAEGNRYNVLLWAACRAAEDGLLVDEDDPAWTALANAADASGLDDDEIYRVLNGAIAIAGEEA